MKAQPLSDFGPVREAAPVLCGSEQVTFGLCLSDEVVPEAPRNGPKRGLRPAKRRRSKVRRRTGAPEKSKSRRRGFRSRTWLTKSMNQPALVSHPAKPKPAVEKE